MLPPVSFFHFHFIFTYLNAKKTTKYGIPARKARNECLARARKWLILIEQQETTGINQLNTKKKKEEKKERK